MIYFKNNNYYVEGIDIIDGFINHALKLNLNVKKISVLDVDYKDYFDGIRNERYYLDMTNDKMKKIIDNKNLKIINSWISNDNLSRQEK